jgi:hypothetical protein
MTTSPPPFGLVRPSSPTTTPWGGAVPAPADNLPFPYPFWVCDAFTSEAFAGNPAAVVLLPAGGFPDVLWMAKAREMRVRCTFCGVFSTGGTRALRARIGARPPAQDVLHTTPAHKR